MDSIEHYLADVEARQPGQFTLDVERALEITAQFTFAQWEWWVLKFVQSAVVLGARRVDLDLSKECWTVRHDGEGLHEFSLLDALRPEMPEVAAQRHLALGVRVALTRACRLDLTFHYDGVCRSWSYPECPRLERVDAVPWRDDWEGTRLRLEGGALQAPASEQRNFLRAALRYAPCAVALNGTLLNQPRFDKPSVPQWIWLAPDLQAETLPVISSCASTQVVSPLQRLELEADKVSALAAYDGARVELTAGLAVLPCWGWQTLVETPGRHRLDLVHHGVVLSWGETEEPGDPAGSYALLTSAGLALEATGSRPVLNEVLETRIKALRRNFRRLYRAYGRAHGPVSLARLAKGY